MNREPAREGKTRTYTHTHTHTREQPARKADRQTDEEKGRKPR